MKKISSRKEIEKIICCFFPKIKEKTPKEIKKIKKLAMGHNIKLGELRKFFCKKCLNPYINSKIRINKGIKSMKCNKCEHISRWKMK